MKPSLTCLEKKHWSDLPSRPGQVNKSLRGSFLRGGGLSEEDLIRVITRGKQLAKRYDVPLKTVLLLYSSLSDWVANFNKLVVFAEEIGLPVTLVINLYDYRVKTRVQMIQKLRALQQSYEEILLSRALIQKDLIGLMAQIEGELASLSGLRALQFIQRKITAIDNYPIESGYRRASQR